MWSSATRIIGFDGPKVVWGLNESLPVCLATDKIRPATQEQALAYLYAHGHRTGVDRTVISDEQQAYIDERRRRGEAADHEASTPEAAAGGSDLRAGDDDGEEQSKGRAKGRAPHERHVAEVDVHRKPPSRKSTHA